MARPRQAGTEATTERLLASAEQEFAVQGYDRARLADIAARVGISRPSLLYHFGTKRMLYAEVVRTTFNRLGDALMASVARGASYDDKLEGCARVFASFLAEHPAMARVTLRELVDGRGPGRSILAEAGARVLDDVEEWARAEGVGRAQEGIPVRAALMYVASALLVRAVAGALEAPLWGNTQSDPRALARALLSASRRIK